MSWPTLFRKPLVPLYIASVLLLLVAAGVWVYHSCTDPQKVFWRTLDQSLSTTGVTVKSSQTANGVAADQILQYSFGGQNVSHSITTLRQGNTTVVTEMLGTPKIDYTKYRTIETDQKRPDGSAMDFSKVMGVWAKDEVGATASARLFPQAVLGTSLPLGGVAVPVADLPTLARKQLIEEIRNDAVYRVDYKAVKKTHDKGRLFYIYDVKINAVAYAKMMKLFAQSVGIHDLDTLDPETFAKQPDFALRLTVDVWAEHMVKAESTSLDGTNTASQSYTSYDIPVTTSFPKQTISVAELQKLLSGAQR